VRGLLLLLPVLAGGLLAAFRIGAQSFWIDEAVSWALASTPLGGLTAALWDEPNMTFYYLLLRLWLVAGASEAWLRAFSAVSAAVALWLGGPLAWRVAGRRAALIFMTLTAANASWIALAQEARGYTLALAFQIAGAAALARASLDQKRSGRWLYLCALALGLALWAHALSAFAALGLAVWTLSVGRRRLPVSKLVGPAALFVLLMLPLAVRVAVGPGNTPIVTAALGLSTLLQATLPLVGRGRSAWLLLPLLGALAAVGAAALGRRARAHPLRQLPLHWLLVQLGGLLLASAAGLRLMEWRYLSFLIPPFLLLAAAGLTRLRPIQRTAAVAILALATAATLRVHYFKAQKEDWRSASRRVLALARPGDGVIVFAWFARAGFDFYAAREARSPVEVLWLASGPSRFDEPQPPPDAGALQTQAAGREHVFLLLSHHCALGRGAQARELMGLLAESHRLAARESFFGVELLRFERRAPGEPEGGLPLFDPCGARSESREG
jgi:mannosyltransferase